MAGQSARRTIPCRLPSAPRALPRWEREIERSYSRNWSIFGIANNASLSINPAPIDSGSLYRIAHNGREDESFAACGSIENRPNESPAIA